MIDVDGVLLFDPKKIDSAYMAEDGNLHVRFSGARRVLIIEDNATAIRLFDVIRALTERPMDYCDHYITPKSEFSFHWEDDTL